MKKLLLSILTTIYLLLSTGVNVEMHYCMGKFAGVDFSWEDNEKCARCGMTEKKSGCCRDEVKFYKYEDSFKSVQYNFNASQFSDQELPNKSYACFSINEYPASFNLAPISDLEYNGPPIYIRNRVFRI